ncbi:MAG: hypothetical protein HFJ79_10330 [Clostridiales bacterium]|jgi:hypothetical protein|nr:hypothetical protein [Clostridiales bacterium]
MALHNELDNLGFHLFVPLCNQCTNREQHRFDEEERELTCRVLGEIPPALLRCESEECEHFELDETAAELYKGLI